MAATVVEAYREMNLFVDTAWDAYTQTMMEESEPCKLMYEARDGDKLPPVEFQGRTWGRLTIRHTETRNRSIGGRRSVNYGTLTIQLFVPYSEKKTNVRRGLALADRIVKDMRRHNGEVEFKRSVAQEVGAEGTMYNINIVTAFEYEQIN